MVILPSSPWFCFCNGDSPNRSAHLIHVEDLGCVREYFELQSEKGSRKLSYDSSLVDWKGIHVVSEGPAEEKTLLGGQAQVQWLGTWAGYDPLLSLFEASWHGRLRAVQLHYVELDKHADTSVIRGPVLQAIATIACLRGHANVLGLAISKAKELTIWSDFAVSSLVRKATLVGQHPAVWAAMFKESLIWQTGSSFTWRQQLNETAMAAPGKLASELLTVLRDYGAFFVNAFQLQDAIRNNQADQDTIKIIVPTLSPALLNLSCGLHLAAARGNLSLMKTFLECGADPNYIPEIEDKPEPAWDHPWGWDAMDLDPWRRSIEVIPVGSALHATVGSDDLLPATKLLLKNGASLRMRDEAGLNPLQKAEYKGAAKTVAFLRDEEREKEGLELALKSMSSGLGRLGRGVGKLFKSKEEEWKADNLWDEGFR